DLAARLGDEHEVLEADATRALVPEARLDRDHIPGDEWILPREAERGSLVDFEADAVPERVLEAVLLAVRGALRRVAGRPEQMARGVEELSSRDAGTNGGLRLVERLAHEPVLLRDQRRMLGHRLAGEERPRHVRPAAGLLVAGPDVDLDRKARGERP